MEINKFRENLKLSREQRELNHWSAIYDEALFTTRIKLDNNESKSIRENKNLLENLKDKYQFYQGIIDLIDVEVDTFILKSKIINLIISYLQIINENGNIIVVRGYVSSKSKRNYRTEKSQILKDLNSMLYNALLNHKNKNLIGLKQESDIIEDNIKIEVKPQLHISIINNTEKWNFVMKNLFQDNVIDCNDEWIGLGPNLSKHPTQLAVLIYLLELFKVLDIKNKNKQIPEIGDFFKVKLSPSWYSQVKGTFKDSTEISKNMLHFPIYEKYANYFIDLDIIKTKR